MRLIAARIVWAFEVEAEGEPLAWAERKTWVLVEKKPVEVRMRMREV